MSPLRSFRHIHSSSNTHPHSIRSTAQHAKHRYHLHPATSLTRHNTVFFRLDNSSSNNNTKKNQNKKSSSIECIAKEDVLLTTTPSVIIDDERSSSDGIVINSNNDDDNAIQKRESLQSYSTSLYCRQHGLLLF